MDLGYAITTASEFVKIANRNFENQRLANKVIENINAYRSKSAVYWQDMPIGPQSPPDDRLKLCCFFVLFRRCPDFS